MSFDANTRVAKIYTQYHFAAENNLRQDNPPCSAGRVDIYVHTGTQIEKVTSIALSGDELKPGKRTKWISFTCAPDRTLDQYRYVLELTDSHA